MGSRVTLNYVFTIFCFTYVHCGFEVRHYRSSGNIASTADAKYQATVAVRSKLECATVCKSQSNCISFSFNNSLRMCSMSSGIAQFVSNRIYYVDCPTDLGYSLWTFPDRSLCLKYVGSAANNDGAKANCTSDNGHLATIDSDSTRVYIRDMLVSVGAYPGYIWFDGYDVDDQNIFRTRNGDILWTSWAVNNPRNNPGEDCIMGELSDGYLTRDLYCDRVHPYLCQIDLD